MIHSLAKTTAVVVSSTILATLTVNAADIRGQAITSFLAGLLYSVEEEVSVCPEHMVLVTQALSPFCMDAYEASAGERCLYNSPQSVEETERNMATPNCRAVSEPNTIPWRNVTLDQAAHVCTMAGKRLPTADEWYKAALGTPDDTSTLTGEHCNVASNRAAGVAETGGGMRCVSDAGAYDMIGNVWEWVDGRVERGVWDDRTLPQSGYVQGVDVSGIAFETSSAQSDAFNGDRLWVDATIRAGVMRGGYYESNSNAGLYAVYAASPPSFSGDAAGFRCAADAH